MPRKPMKPCSYPGCPRLTNETYCNEHKKLMAEQYEKNGRDYDHHKRYGRRWQKIRSAYINAHPLCEMCMDEGRYVAAEEVHHKIPLKDGGTNEAENLQSLCRKHHAQVHAQMGTRTHGGVVYEFGDSHHR